MPGLLRGVARTAVIAGTASSVAGRVQHRQQSRWASQEAEQQAAQTAPAAGSLSDDQLQQLEKLGDLRDKGILTQAEFDAKKQQLLGL